MAHSLDHAKLNKARSVHTAQSIYSNSGLFKGVGKSAQPNESEVRKDRMTPRKWRPRKRDQRLGPCAMILKDLLAMDAAMEAELEVTKWWQEWKEKGTREQHSIHYYHVGLYKRWITWTFKDLESTNWAKQRLIAFMDIIHYEEYHTVVMKRGSFDEVPPGFSKTP